MQIPLKVNISLKSSMTLKEEEEGAVVELQHLLELQLEEADINNNLDCTYTTLAICGNLMLLAPFTSVDIFFFSVFSGYNLDKITMESVLSKYTDKILINWDKVEKSNQ